MRMGAHQQQPLSKLKTPEPVAGTLKQQLMGFGLLFLIGLGSAV